MTPSLIVVLNNIYSGKVHDIHKYKVKIIGSDSKLVAYLDNLLKFFTVFESIHLVFSSIHRVNCM